MEKEKQLKDEIKKMETGFKIESFLPHYNDIIIEKKAELKGRQEARKELIEEFEKMIERYNIDVDLDNYNSKEYPELYKLIEKINENNKQLKKQLQEMKEKK